MRCDPVVIAAGQVVAPVVFEAAENARPVVGTVPLVGRARVGDRKEDLDYVAGATTLGPDIAHEALAGGMSLAAGQPAWLPRSTPARVTRGFRSGGPRAAPLDSERSPARRVVAQGRRLELDLTVTRRAGFSERGRCRRLRPPAQPVLHAAVTIAKTATSAAAALVVGQERPARDVHVPAPWDRRRIRSARTRTPSRSRTSTFAEPSNPITVTVRPAPVNLARQNPRGHAQAGARLEVDVTVARQNGFTDGLTLTLAAPASSKLSADRRDGRRRPDLGQAARGGGGRQSPRRRGWGRRPRGRPGPGRARRGR